MIEVIEHNNTLYPAFQSEGFAAKFSLPFAQQVCFNYGCDVGCNRKEWAFVDKDGISALMVDPSIDPSHDALHLPPGSFDYLHSSHMLEHVDDWVAVLDYWKTKLKPGGVLFLYLPDYSQSYWRPWSNRKHRHILSAQILKDYLVDREWNNVFVSGVDLNNSFMVMANK